LAARISSAWLARSLRSASVSRSIVAHALTYPMDRVCGRDNAPPRAGKLQEPRAPPDGSRV